MSSYRKTRKGQEGLPSALKRVDSMDASVERRILISVIISDSYCSLVFRNKRQISSLLPAESSRIVFDWAINFYDKYNVAPKSTLRNLFEDESKEMSKELSDDIEDILIGISKQYSNEDFNHEYEFEQTRKYVDERHLEVNLKETQALLDLGRTEEAQEMKIGFQPIDWNDGDREFDAFKDVALMDQAINATVVPLLNLKAGLGQLVNKEITRDSYVAFIAAEKSGKSWLLMHIFMRAIDAGLNIVWFGAGDMTKTQMTQRFLQMSAQQPIDKEDCGERLIPKLDCVYNQTGQCNHTCGESIFIEDGETGEVERLVYEDLEDDYTPCTACVDDSKLSERIGKQFKGAIWYEPKVFGREFCDEMVGLNVEEAQKAIHKMFRRAKKSQYRKYDYATGTLSVNEMDKIMKEEQKKTGFKPDIVVVDYSDILDKEPSVSGDNERAIYDARYRASRRFAQEWNCAFVTASQGNSVSYKKLALTRGSFNGDKRILSHSTAVFGINKSPVDNEVGCARVNKILARNTAPTESQAVLLQDFASGQPVLDSYYATIEDLETFHPAYISAKQKEMDENTNER